MSTGLTPIGRNCYNNHSKDVLHFQQEQEMERLVVRTVEIAAFRVLLGTDYWRIEDEL
jgi:hypothetical protein